MTPPPDATVARLLAVERRGSTSPAVAETQTGARFVLKLVGAGPGPRGLLTEFLATRIAGVLGVRVAPVRPLYLPAGFPWTVGTDEFDDLVQRSAGWNLGVALIEGAHDATAEDLVTLPLLFAGRLVLADRLLQNVDRTQHNPHILIDAGGEPWAIDFGACLFLERILAHTRFAFALPRGHLLEGSAASALTAAAVKARLPSSHVIDGWLRQVPEAWLEDVLLPHADLVRAVSQYVGAFADQL